MFSLVLYVTQCRSKSQQPKELRRQSDRIYDNIDDHTPNTNPNGSPILSPRIEMETRRENDRQPRPSSAISDDHSQPNVASYDSNLSDTGYVTMNGIRPIAPTTTTQ